MQFRYVMILAGGRLLLLSTPIEKRELIKEWLLDNLEKDA